MDDKSVVQLLQEAIGKANNASAVFCHNYCRFTAEYGGDAMTDEQFEELAENHCADCPMGRLF